MLIDFGAWDRLHMYWYPGTRCLLGVFVYRFGMASS